MEVVFNGIVYLKQLDFAYEKMFRVQNLGKSAFFSVYFLTLRTFHEETSTSAENVKNL